MASTLRMRDLTISKQKEGQRPLPTGTVTFLFTDIEGSTPLWDRDPEGMKAALSRHNAILDDAVTAHGGQVFKFIGDAFQAAFVLPHQALRAAAAQALRWQAMARFYEQNDLLNFGSEQAAAAQAFRWHSLLH